MIVGIDASNLRAGGGVTHLVSLLSAGDPRAHDIAELRVWGPQETLARLPQRSWIRAEAPPALDGPLWQRLRWQRFELPRLAEEVDLLFAPGGNIPHRIRPVVTMSRNMLPFEWRERRRYGLSKIGVRLQLLAWSQRRALRRADGVIFLTAYAESVVRRAVEVEGRTRVILHGIDPRFRLEPRPQRAIADASPERPLEILYVSIIDVYKHQWQVARAVAQLHEEGLPVKATFVGPAYPPALARFEATLDELDPERRFLDYAGPIPYDELPAAYARADLFAFASSCENGPNVLLEAMGAGMPIACAERGPMPEVLGEAGRYFDPEDPDSIARCLRVLLEDPALRAELADRAFAEAATHDWARCAEATFAFLREVGQG